MRKMYRFEVYDKSKIDMGHLNKSLQGAWSTSGCVIAQSRAKAIEKVHKSIDCSKYISSYGLSESIGYKPYALCRKGSDVFIEDHMFDL